VRGGSRSVVVNAAECRMCYSCDEFYFVRMIKYVSGVSFKTSCDLYELVSHVFECLENTKKTDCERKKRLRKGIGRRRSSFKVSNLFIISLFIRYYT